MDKNQAAKRLDKLKKQLREIDHAYYVLDQPLVTDAVRDSLKDEVEKIEAAYPVLVTSDSPTQRVGGKALGKFAKRRHAIPKYSFDDLFSFEEVREWDGRVKKFLDLPASSDVEYVCELKIDGLNMSLIYRRGVLESAVTRGDGVVGEVVTHTVRTIKSIPLKISEEIDVEAGGEVYMPRESFERLNRAEAKRGGQVFANPRNAAAGTVRQLDPRVASSRDLDAFIYSNYTTQNRALKTQEDVLRDLGRLGFRVNPHFKKVKNIEGVLKVFLEWQKNRQRLPYDIDGIVVKVNNLSYQERLGRTAKHVRWAAAYKFAAEQVTTVVEDIAVQVGRTGALTPVAHLRPVALAGSVVKRATLHNQDEIERLDVRIGDTVVLQKAGDIIPDIIEVLPKMRTGRERKFKMPARCPICNSPVKRREGEVAYYCANPSCYAQQQENLSHFVSKGAFDIDGLGPKILELLQREDLVKDPADIFLLQEEDLLPLERFAEKSAANLVMAIANSKKIDLAKFIYALGIRHVGEETARLLAKKFSVGRQFSINKLIKLFDHFSIVDLEQVEGIGPKVGESVIVWFKDKKNLALLKKLAQAKVDLVASPVGRQQEKLTGKSFVLTGKLDSFSRGEAKDKIRALGGEVSSSVSRNTAFVVAGDDPGSKYDKAQKLGVKIINEAELIRLLQD